LKVLTLDDKRSLELQGLKKFTSYQFRILAKTVAGDGPTVSIEGMTKEDGKIRPPTTTMSWLSMLNSVDILLHIKHIGYTRKNLTACQQDVFALHFPSCNKVDEAHRLATSSNKSDIACM
jgi:hypothetical protein